MAKVIEHRKALILRKEGRSYSQIKKELGISKSTLSGWLKRYPLSHKQIRLLRDCSEERIEKCRNTKREKLESRLLRKYRIQRKRLSSFSNRELFIAGLFLYWGEGAKSSRNVLSINNTDPNLVKFALYWIRKSLYVPKRNISVYLHLYSDMDIEKEINYWSKELEIDKSQFNNPYIKKSKRTELDQKSYGHGTCGLRVCITSLKEDILMAIKAVSDVYGGSSAILV